MTEVERSTPTDRTGGPPFFAVRYRGGAAESPRRTLNVNVEYGTIDAEAENQAIFDQPDSGVVVIELIIRGHRAQLATYTAPDGGAGLVVGWAEDADTLVQITSTQIDQDKVLSIAEQLSINSSG